MVWWFHLYNKSGSWGIWVSTACFDYGDGHPDGLWSPPSVLLFGLWERFARRPVSLELCMFNSVACCMVISCTKVSKQITEVCCNSCEECYIKLQSFALVYSVLGPTFNHLCDCILHVTQLLGWLSRNQSPVRRLIWLWRAASWAKS